MLQGKGFGRRVLPGTGTLTQIWGNPNGKRPKVAGSTFDWSTVPVLQADLTLPDGTVILAGTRFLRYGSMVAEKTQIEVQTLTFTGGATGGTYTLGYNDGENIHTTPALPYNATAAQIEAALNDLEGLHDNIGVLGTGPFNVNFHMAGNILPLIATASLTGGTSPAITVGTTTNGIAEQGTFGLYDATATDGRQNRVRGHIYFTEASVLYDDELSAYVALFEGGTVFLERMQLDDVSATPPAGFMTTAQFFATFPLVTTV